MVGKHALVTYSQALNIAIWAKIMLEYIDQERDSNVLDRGISQGIVSKKVTS